MWRESMMDDLISRLSEIRSEYNCFDEDEKPYYHALSEAIGIISRYMDRDTINRQEAIDAMFELDVEHRGSLFDAVIDTLMDLPPDAPQRGNYESNL